MNWIEVSVNTTPDDLYTLYDRITEVGIDTFVTESEDEYETFLEENRKYWDYIDEDLRESFRGLCRVKFYIEDNDEGRESLARYRTELPEYELISNFVRDEDWENNWREYYKPIEMGEKLMIVPDWLDAPETDRKVLRLEPGLAFGTGAHATTRMTLQSLEKYAAPGKTALDIGCGSGILAVAALVLGCDRAVGCDIDEKSPEVSAENAALNGVNERFSAFAGDIIGQPKLREKLRGKYDIVLANIVADVIIPLAPMAKEFLAEGGVFITSGIIDTRADEVKSAIIAAGYTVIDEDTQEGWYRYTCTLA